MFVIDLTGVADGLGGLTGEAQYDGINPGTQSNPGGGTGYSCHFPFTGHGGRLTATSPPTGAA